MSRPEPEGRGACRADERKMLLSQKKLSDFFRESPLFGAELDLTRDRSPLRDDVAL